MVKTEAIILKNLSKHSHFEEYYKIIDVIKSQSNINPDICIESCKALIEGVSKTILINLDKAITVGVIDGYDLPKLFKEAVRKLSDECVELEGDFVSRFSSIIQVVGEIRNKRSDISHGRMAPKPISSSLKLASTVVSMTDTMLEYLLDHYFSLDFSNDELVYDSEELEPFNNWLDEITEFPIKKAKYSKVLYENDYDEYESRYTDEFMKIQELDNEEIKEPPTSRMQIEFEHEIKEIESLVSEFNEELFWDKDRINSLQLFSEKENLNQKKLMDLINEYIFSEKVPLRDDVAKVMNERPNLAEYKEVVSGLIERIIVFTDNLNNK